MIKLGIPEDDVKYAMQKGVLHLITLVPVDDLNPQGVNHIASMIYDFCAIYGKPSVEYKESKQHWDEFWGVTLFIESFVSF